MAWVSAAGLAAIAAFMATTPQAQPKAMPRTRVKVPKRKMKTMPVGGTMKSTRLITAGLANQYRKEIYGYTHVAKNVAVPMTVRDGVIKINSDATHAASEQRNSTLRSRALK